MDDLPPKDSEVEACSYGHADSENFDRLRNWVQHTLKKVLHIPLKRAERGLEYLKMTQEERNSAQFAPDRLPPQEIMDRLEDDIISRAVTWLNNRHHQLTASSVPSIHNTLCGVTLDEEILLEGIILIAKHRQVGLFFSDAKCNVLNGVREEEMPSYWPWKHGDQWSLPSIELPTDVLSQNLGAFLAKAYPGLYEPSRKGQETIAEWFRTLWRGFRGETVAASKRYREQNRLLRGAVSVSQTEAAKALAEVEKLQAVTSRLEAKVERLTEAQLSHRRETDDMRAQIALLKQAVIAKSRIAESEESKTKTTGKSKLYDQSGLR